MSSDERRETVPAGYKMTEVGVIPEDWEIATLGEIGNFKNGINKSESDFGTGYPFINLLDVFGQNKLSRATVTLGLVKTSAVEREVYDIRPGDVLFVRSSVKPEGVGLTALIEDSFDSTVFSGFLIRFRASTRIDHLYKRYCFLESGFRKRLISLSTISANTNINQVSLACLLHAFPHNKAEQRAIAEALSDVDNLLDALDRLIAKKRAVKQAVMQQLLTGKTRLPGFAGEWEETTLGEIGAIVGGGTPSTSVPEFWSGSVSWVTPTDITACESRFLATTERQISEKGLSASSAQLLPVGSILLCTRATIGEARIAVVPVATNQGFQSIIVGKNASNQFVYYKILTLKSQMLARAIGSTFLEIGRQALASIEILLPPLPEQRAIAAVLSDIDDEIAALEKRRDKTRRIKDGMMQQLLTGRVRLVKVGEKEWERN